MIMPVWECTFLLGEPQCPFQLWLAREPVTPQVSLMLPSLSVPSKVLNSPSQDLRVLLSGGHFTSLLPTFEHFCLVCTRPTFECWYAGILNKCSLSLNG